MGKSTVFIAAGHGGQDCGNTASGAVERDELLGITQGVRDWYGALNITPGLGGAVFLDDQLDLAGEVAALKPWKLDQGDLAIDLHLDFKPAKERGGALVLHNGRPLAQRFARAFLPRWCELTGIISNGVFLGPEVAPLWRGWDNFGFLRPPWPSVIIELGCLNAPHDMQQVRNPLFQHVLGQVVWETFNQVRSV